MKNISPLIFAIIILFTSCSKNLPANIEPLFCTENFVTYTLEIPGAPLDDFFTFRTSTFDSLRLEHIFADATIYPVLDDQFTDRLIDRQETFLFVGRRGETSFEVPFVFTSDRCHIVKISGPAFYTPVGN